MLYQAGEFIDHIAIFGESEVLCRIAFEQMNLELVKDYIKSRNVQCEWVDTPSADVYFNIPAFEHAKRNIDALKKRAPTLARELRVLDGIEAMQKEGLRTPTAVGAVVFMAGKLSPYKLVSYILENAVKVQGLNLQTNTPALAVRKGGEFGKWLVETPRGCISADRVVFATNAHTSHLLPVFRGWIYPVRGQMSSLIPPRSLLAEPLTHTYSLVRKDRTTACYLIQRPLDENGVGGELMLGGCRELENNRGIGLQDEEINPDVARRLRESVKECFRAETGYGDDDDEKEDEPVDNFDLRKSFIEKFRRLRLGGGTAGYDVWDAAEGFGFGHDLHGDYHSGKPALSDLKQNCTGTPTECRAKMEWTGTMGYSKDGRPFIGRVPAVCEADAKRLNIPAMSNTNGLWVLAGFEGHGMAFTTGSAKALATMIASEEYPHNSISNFGKLYTWFPRTFEVTPVRLGLSVAAIPAPPPLRSLPTEEWEEISPEDWEIVESNDDGVANDTV